MRIIKSLTATLPLLAILLLLGACQSEFVQTYLNVGGIPKTLDQRVKQFEGVVRWGALQKMYVFYKHAHSEPVEIPLGLDNVRVTGYEVANALVEVEPTRWTQTVVIDYVLTDRQIVRQLVDHQVWVSDDGGKIWFRENPPPQFL